MKRRKNIPPPIECLTFEFATTNTGRGSFDSSAIFVGVNSNDLQSINKNLLLVAALIIA